MIELKPCPFCGGEAECESAFSSVYDEIRAYVKCKKCGLLRWYRGIDVYELTGRETDLIAKYHAEAKRMAIEAWNRRVGEG